MSGEPWSDPQYGTKPGDIICVYQLDDVHYLLTDVDPADPFAAGGDGMENAEEIPSNVDEGLCSEGKILSKGMM